MPAMRAYLDDFGSITIWMEKNFYGGKSDSFFLVAEDEIGRASCRERV